MEVGDVTGSGKSVRERALPIESASTASVVKASIFATADIDHGEHIRSQFSLSCFAAIVSSFIS